jgi:predicted RNA binding protein YcfA (HicA-like mRNA interferase family)
VKTRDLVRHLRSHGCEFRKHGAKHDLYWNPTNKKVTTIPRHSDIKRFTAVSVCRTLEIPEP